MAESCNGLQHYIVHCQKWNNKEVAFYEREAPPHPLCRVYCLQCTPYAVYSGYIALEKFRETFLLEIIMCINT